MEKHELFIGVDISKNKLDISVVRAGNKKALYHQVYDNTKEDIDKMLNDLVSRTDVCPSAQLFCMEHTGVYSMPLAYRLSEKKLHYSIVPATAIQRSIGIKRGKSDKADSVDIARYALLHEGELEQHQLATQSLAKLKLLLGLRERLVKARKMFKASASETVKFLDPSQTRELLKESRSLIRVFDNRIKKVEARIQELVDSEPDLKQTHQLVTSVTGVGTQIAYNLIVDTRCFTAFDTSRQLACYAGVAPFEHSSGSSIRGRSRGKPYGQ